jgi:hypothetical protein
LCVEQTSVVGAHSTCALNRNTMCSLRGETAFDSEGFAIHYVWVVTVRYTTHRLKAQAQLVSAQQVPLLGV